MEWPANLNQIIPLQRLLFSPDGEGASHVKIRASRMVEKQRIPGKSGKDVTGLRDRLFVTASQLVRREDREMRTEKWAREDRAGPNKSR